MYTVARTCPWQQHTLTQDFFFSLLVPSHKQANSKNKNKYPNLRTCIQDPALRNHGSANDCDSQWNGVFIFHFQRATQQKIIYVMVSSNLCISTTCALTTLSVISILTLTGQQRQASGQLWRPHGRKWQEECPTLGCRAPRPSTASYHDFSLQSPTPSFPLSSLTPGRWFFLILTFIKLKSLPSSFWQGLMRLSRQSILNPSTPMPPYSPRHS